MALRPSVRRVRRQKNRSLAGFIVTWDVDSKDHAQCTRLRRFVFGYTSRWNGTAYRYAGFIERTGVQYLGQSVLFVTAERRAELERFLEGSKIEHFVREASVGAPVLS